MKVVVTGAAGQISYSLIPFLCENGIFKSNEKIDFSLVEIPSAMEKLSGFVKELEDSAYSNINSISVHDNINSAVEDADWCLLVGSIPRGIVLNGKGRSSKNKWRDFYRTRKSDRFKSKRFM